MTTAQIPAPRPVNKNWLLVTFRQWHSWGGLFLSVFILTVAVTGIILNHKDFFLRGEIKQEKASGLLTASTDFNAIPITFAAAQSLARDHFGDGPIEKIELKDEHGVLIYKIVKGKGQEVVIDAHSGAMTTKYGFKVDPKDQKTAKAGINWGKIVDDLHTGKILGTPGQLFIDFTSLVIIALTLSGIYLWWVPFFRKRRSAQDRQASVARAPGKLPADRLPKGLIARAAVATPSPEPETVEV